MTSKLVRQEHIMITRTATAGGFAVTFAIDETRPASVVGDFNGWDPQVNPLVGGTATVVLRPGRYAFRYLVDGGEFLDDPGADAIEDNGLGGSHGVVVVEPLIDLTEPPLEAITGIGPKIAAVLMAAGVTSLTDLAAAGSERLRAILKAAGLRVAPSVDGWSSEAWRLLDSGR